MARPKASWRTWPTGIVAMQILARMVPLLLGLRGYLDEQTDQGQ